MERGFYIAGVGGSTFVRQLDVLAHNIANANTSGYRTHRTSFATVLSDKTQQLADSSAYLSNGYQYVDMSPAEISSTGNDLDIALRGNAFLRVQLDGNREAYTRAGNLKLNAEGTLLTAGGKPVLDDGGQAITLPQGRVTIGEDGSISVEKERVAKLGLMRIIDDRRVEKLEGVLLSTVPANVEPAGGDARVLQGYLEGSNVNAVLAMTELVDVQRSYQSMMKVVEQYNQEMGLLAERVGRITG